MLPVLQISKQIKQKEEGKKRRMPKKKIKK